MSEEKKPPSEGAVGYGRPPKHTQFPPKTSGNPSGGRKPQPSSPFDLERRMQESLTVTSKGKPLAMSRIEIELRSVVKKAFAKDLKAMEHFLALVVLHDQSTGQALNSRTSVMRVPAHLPPTMVQLLFERFGAPPWTPEHLEATQLAYRAAATTLELRLEKEGVYRV